MDSSPESSDWKFSDLALIISIIALIGFAVGASGCASKPQGPGLKVQSKLEIAVKSIPSDWLTPCDLLDSEPENTVKGLLQDMESATFLLGVCAARQYELQLYLRKLIADGT